MTASAARASACNSAASSSDPTTASTPHAATASPFAWLRTRPRTVWPSAIRADATAPPIKPLAPVTKICILALPRFGRDENVAANSSPLHVAKPNTETTRRVLRPKSPTASPTAGPTAPNRMRRSPTTRPEREWPTRPFRRGPSPRENRESDELDARGSAPTATEINRHVRQPKSQEPLYRSGRRPPGRRDIRGQACRACARDQERLPDALTQTAARPAMQLRAGERNS